MWRKSKILSRKFWVTFATPYLYILAYVFQMCVELWYRLKNFFAIETSLALGAVILKMFLKIEKPKIKKFDWATLRLRIVSWSLIILKKDLTAVCLNQILDSGFHFLIHTFEFEILRVACRAFWRLNLLLFPILMELIVFPYIELALNANNFSTLFALLWAEWNFFADKTRKKFLSTKHFFFILVLIWWEKLLVFGSQNLLEVVIWDEKVLSIMQWNTFVFVHLRFKLNNS